ncbi:MAG TPA: GNVR domain-containing protein [Polyangia bacterium]|jgi:capsule polysaccharide export protein KpsE/RkpR
MTSMPGHFDAVGTLRARWRRLLFLPVLALVVATAYALLTPKWYRTQIVLVPTPASKGSLPMLGAAGGLPAGLDLPLDLGLGSSDVERIAAVLRSMSVTDAVVTRFGLMERYRAKYVEEARKELWDHCGIRAEKRAGTVTLSCEDRSPAVAQQLAEYFGEYGNQVFRRVSSSSAAEERRFLEKRVAEARTDMADASRKLRDFQEKNRVIDLTEQSKAVVTSMAQLRAELLSKQMQLSYLDSFSARDEASSGQLRRQIGILEGKLRSMEESKLGPVATPASQPEPRKGAKGVTANSGSGLFPPAMNVPRLRFELEQLFREQKFQETLFLTLSQRYEMARVSEARDTSTFQILDHATLPTKKDRPKRALICMAGLLLGLLAGFAWALLPDWWRSFGAEVR